MKKILIIGAGFLQQFVIKKANELNYYVFALDGNPNAIGFKYADENSIFYIDSVSGKGTNVTIKLHKRAKKGLPLHNMLI